MSKTRTKVLLFGGGGTHDFRKICPVLKTYLTGDGRFSVDYVREDFDALGARRLSRYDLVVLYHTGGNLPLSAKRGLMEWVARGGGFVGVHSASCSFSNSPEYLAMLGGTFIKHPFERDYIVSLADTEHPVTRDIAGYTVKHWEPWPVYEYTVHDEQYLLDWDRRVHLLATTVYQGKMWPVAWVKPWGSGRVFYLALGHDVKACRNDFFGKIFIGGVAWAGEGE